MKLKKIVIVTGLSGAGKTTALDILEDMDFYTIDNLPLGLEKYLLESKIEKIAVGIDIRTFKKAEDFFEWIEILKNSSEDYSIIFLEATDRVILGRYNLSRRAHPIKADTLLKSIQKEKEIFYPIKEISNLVIDTTDLRPINLEKIIKDNISEEPKKLNLHIQSFGFKYGIPLDSDLMFDVRFLPNPYYISELKEKNGYDTDIIDYIFSNKDSIEFYDDLYKFIEKLLPKYIAEGKKHLTISIGCSGGKHRSVVFANKLKADLSKLNSTSVYLSHREKEFGNW